MRTPEIRLTGTKLCLQRCCGRMSHKCCSSVMFIDVVMHWKVPRHRLGPAHTSANCQGLAVMASCSSDAQGPPVT